MTTKTTIPDVNATSALGWLRGIIFSQEGVLFIVLVALMLAVGSAYPNFSKPNNISDIFESNAYVAVAAVGMSILIISGNIDISVGVLIGVLALFSGTLVTNGWPVWLSWLLPILVSMVIGAINGFFVAYMNIPAIVVTLGMWSILKGSTIIVLGGTTIYQMPPEFFLAQQSWLGIPSTLWFMVIATLIGMLWMRYTATGRAIYAVGGNAEAARLSGINPKRMIMTAFILNNLMVGIAGVMYATQFNTIQASLPVGLEMLIITSAVVGGVSILGGSGTVVGSTLAAILISAIRSSMIFVSVPAEWLRAVHGVLSSSPF